MKGRLIILHRTHGFALWTTLFEASQPQTREVNQTLWENAACQTGICGKDIQGQTSFYELAIMDDDC